MAEHGLGVLAVDLGREVHHMHAGRGHVVDKQELAPRRARAPDRDLGGVADLGFVEAPGHRGDDVAVLRVVVVARAVQVGGHHAAVVHAVTLAVLAVVALAQLDARDLGHRVGLVGRFEQAGQQRVLGHRLGCQLGVDAAGAQKQQLLDPVLEGRVDHVGLHHQVVVDEVGRVDVVGVDAADAGGSQVDLVGALGGKEGAHGGLVGQVQLGVGAGENVAGRLALREQGAHDGRADHAAVAGDVDAGRGRCIVHF